MKVVYCGQLDYYPDAMDHLGIKQGMDALGWDWYVVDPSVGEPSGNLIASQINEIKPDLVFHGNTDSLSKRVCPKINKGISQVFWMLDYRTPEMLPPGMWEMWTESAPYLDSVFISARDHIPLWEAAFGVQCFFAPHACWIPPKLVYDPEFEYEVLFIGVRHNQAPFNRRTALLEEIARRVPVAFVNSSDLKERNQIWRDMPAYYHSSKIVLDVSHFWENWGYVSGRYWYTATLGACTISKHFPGCENFFPNELKWYFDDANEAEGLIKNLLANDSVRENTKDRVAKYAWNNHNYTIRFRQMMYCLETGFQAKI